MERHGEQLQRHENQLLQASRRGVRSMLVLTGDHIIPGDNLIAVVKKNVKDLCGGHILEDSDFQTLPYRAGVGHHPPDDLQKKLSYFRPPCGL